MSVAEETEVLTLPEVTARLKALEMQLGSISTAATIRVSIVPNIEFIILFDGKEVWRGRDEEAAYKVIADAPATVEVAMDWDAPTFIRL